MKHNGRYTRFPRDPDLSRVVNAAAARIVDRLEASFPPAPSCSTDDRCLTHKPIEIVETLVRCCTRLFAWALPANDTPFSDLTLVDHGSPLGVVSLLAKECNLGTVIYNDIESATCCEVQEITRAIGTGADYDISGDIHLTTRFLETHAMDCDVFVSCDEIQNLADLGEYFEALYDLSDTNLSFALSAHLTQDNPTDDLCRSTTRSGAFGQRPTAQNPTRPRLTDGLPHPHALLDELTNLGFEADVLSGYRVNDGSIIDDVLTHLQGIRELIKMIAPGIHTHHPARKKISPFVLRGEKPHPLQTVTTPSVMLPTRYRGVVQRAVRFGTS